MADVRPLRGIHYSRSLLQDWTKVLCPVYDIIPPGQHEQLYSRSPYNFVRLEAGRDLPQDTPSDNKYMRAAATLSEWLDSGVLEVDRNPAIYVHDHIFDFAGRRRTRTGLIARVHLEEWDRMVIRPHESTFADARSDRLSLLWAIRANTSPILSLYDDEGDIRSLLAEERKREPAINLEVDGGEGHRLWRLTDPSISGKISAALAGRPLYIADGHHRYESALAYRRQKRTASPSGQEEPFDFAMMTLVDSAEPDLIILPPHRLVRGVAKPDFDSLRHRLEDLFHIREWDAAEPAVWDRVDAWRKNGAGAKLVLFGLSGGSALSLEPRREESLAPMMPYFHSDLYKTLEVSIIDHVILEKLLALNHEKDKVNLGYTNDRQDAINRVLTGEYQMAFLLEPIKPAVIKAIADLGDKMPKKSTYFYPKVPAGLILNRLA